MPQPIKIVQPRRTPNEVPWEAPFQYECSEGHRLEAEKAKTRCLAVVHGQPCPGVLTRVGRGSRTQP